MMKRALLALMMLASVLGLVGCDREGYIAINMVERDGGDYWSARYETFKGYKERVVTLPGGGVEHAFIVDIVTDAGALSMSIKGKDGETLYRGSDMPTSSFIVIARKGGDYTVRFDGDWHSGSFSVTWK